MAPWGDPDVNRAARNGVESMLQLLFLTFFLSVILLSISVVIDTARQEMPHIRRALGLVDTQQRPATVERRVRVTRQAQFRPLPARSLRAAA